MVPFIPILLGPKNETSCCKVSNTDNSVSVVNQYYEAQVYDVFVIKGNAAVFKCNVPSFVSDHLDVISWEDTLGTKYLPPSDSDYGKHLLVILSIVFVPRGKEPSLSVLYVFPFMLFNRTIRIGFITFV